MCLRASSARFLDPADSEPDRNVMAESVTNRGCRLHQLDPCTSGVDKPATEDDGEQTFAESRNDMTLRNRGHWAKQDRDTLTWCWAVC